MSNPNRHPSGTPAGGRFAAGSRAEADVDLVDRAAPAGSGSRAGDRAVCAGCGQMVTADGRGAWVDDTDGDGCDSSSGSHAGVGRVVADEDGHQVLNLDDNGDYAPLRARVVMAGDTYGRGGALTNDGEPMVEFYDRRYSGSWFDDSGHGHGQFISRYQVSTLQEGGDSRAGLDLAGGIRDWSATAQSRTAAVAWATHEVARRLAEADDDDWADSDVCSECGAGLDDGEGWDGLCGNCADRAEQEGRWS